MSEKPESSLQDLQSNNTVAGVPIKKRLLAWTKSVSPPSGVVSCKTEGSESSTKSPILSETEPTKVKMARKHSFEPAIDLRPVPIGCQHEAAGRGGFNLVSGQDKEAGKMEEPIINNRSMFPQGLLSESRVSPHSTVGEGNVADKAILNNRPALPVACKIEEPAIDSSLVSPQELLSKVRAPSFLSAVKGNVDGKIIPNSDSAWQGGPKSTVSTGTSLGRPLMEDGVTPPSTMLSGLCNDGRHLDAVSVKVEKMDSCSHNLALVGQYSQLKKQSDSEKALSCHKNRLNWDLNTIMEAWEGSSSESTMNHEDTNDLGLQRKCLLAGVHTEADGTDLTVGQTSTVDTGRNPNLPSLSLSTSEHFSSYASLDLQLRPPCKANLGLDLGVSSHLAELNSIAEMSKLNLSLSGNVDVDASGSGKPNSFDERSQNTTIEVNLSSTKIIGSRPVKREPCDGKFNEASNSASSSNMKSAISSNSKITSVSVVKPEPREEPSQHCCEEPRQLLYGEFDNNNLVSSGTYVAENSKVMDLFTDHGKIGLVSGITTSADNTSSITTGVVGMDMNLPSQSLAPECGTTHYSGRVRNDVNESCNENRVFGETPHNLLESAVAQGKDVNAPCEALGLAVVTSSLPLEHIGSDDKGSVTTNDSSLVIGTMGSNDDKLATHKTGVVENNEEKNSSQQFDKSSHHGITEADEQKVCGEISDAVLDVNERKTHKSGGVDGIKRPVPKDGERDDFEDGEVRDPTLHDEGGDRVLPGEDSSEKREANQLDGSTAVVDVLLKMPVDVGVSEIKVEDPEESKNVDDSLCADERDSCISTADNQQEVLAVGCLNVTTSKKHVIKTIQKFTVDNMKEKGCETKSNPKRDVLVRVSKGSSDKMSSIPENSKGLDMIPEKHSPKKDNLKVNLGKQESGKEKQSRIIKLTSATDRSSHGKVTSNDNKSPLIQSEEVKMTDRPVVRCKPYSRETRDGFFKDRYPKFTSYRNQDQYSGKHRSDLMRIKERGNTHPDGSHYIKNMEAEPAFNRFKKSTGMRYPRHNNSSEIAYIGTDCRVVRKHGEDESSNLSCLPSRRRSPGPVDREGHPVMGVQVASRSFISPGRCIGRDIPDSLPLNADEKRMRALPDVMGDLPLRAQHRLQFEREENAYIRRERRSLSPRRRRGIPLRFRNEYSPHQWSPPRRSPNIYEGHPELGHIRSPPILTHDRMRSPRQRPCFPDDVIVRRPGSPQSFMTRVSDDGREIHLRRNDCLRSDRVLERNIQRFDMIDPRETTEEEYLEHLHYNQFCELGGGDERIDVRSICEERRGFVRPIRQRFNASEDEGSLHNHAGNGPTFRFRSEAMEGFSERGGSRDFNGQHIQSRLGNVHDNMRGIDEREQYHGRQGWSEADFTGVRPKRRRM